MSRADLAFIRQHRWAHNRLVVAVQLCVLRYPGRVLNRGEQPPAALLGMIGAQLKIAPALWERYAARDQTRRQHQLELVRRLGLTLLSREHIRELVTWLLTIGGPTTQGMVLVRAVIDELRVRKIVRPRISVIERIAPQAATRTDRLLFEQLSGPLAPENRHSLDQLLEFRGGAAYSTLAWLRMPPGAPSARSVLRHMERLKAIRALGLPQNLDRRVCRNRLLRLAREGAQTAVYQLKEYADARRYATLVAIVLEAEATLTDEILNLHDRLIGSFFAKAKHKHERARNSLSRAVFLNRLGEIRSHSRISDTGPVVSI